MDTSTTSSPHRPVLRLASTGLFGAVTWPCRQCCLWCSWPERWRRWQAITARPHTSALSIGSYWSSARWRWSAPLARGRAVGGVRRALTPSGAWSANLSLIVAFFLAATSGHRRAAWVVIVVGYVSSVWLAPLAYGNPVGSLTFALALAGWLAVLVIAAEVVRLRRERTIETRPPRALEARRQTSEERLQMARDLHDVFGHNISLINVQAGSDSTSWTPTLSRPAPRSPSRRSPRTPSTSCAPCSSRSAKATRTPHAPQLPALTDSTSSSR